MQKLQISFLIFILFNFTIEAQVIWESTNGPNGSLVADIGINSKGWLYAGGWWGGAGLYRSKDKGKTWTRCDTRYGQFEIFTIAINNKDDIFIGNDWEGLLRSTDDGETWDSLRYKYPLNECWCVAFDKAGNIYAGDGDWSGIVKSTYNGETWTNFVNLPTISLAIGPDDYIYAGTWRGVYRSTDEGANWVKMSDGLPDLSISCIEFDSAGTVYVGTGTGHSKGNGIYYSGNHGETWAHLSLGDTVVQSLILQGSKFIAGTLEYGVLISTDSGESWIASNAGLTNKNVFRLKMNSDKELFTASDTDGGIHKSTDDGKSWKQTGLPRAQVISLAVNNNRKSLYAGTYDGVHKLELNSGEWINLGLNNYRIMSVASINDSIIFAGTYKGLFRSPDAGKNWERTAMDTYYVVIDFIAQKDSSVYLLTPKDLYVSYDYGKTFENLTNSISYQLFDAIDVNAAGDIFIANSGKVFRRSKGSSELITIFSGTSISEICVNDRNILFVSERSPSGGIFRSGDNGITWQKIYNGDVTTIFATQSQVILASIFNHGIIYSKDDGVTWTDLSPDFKSQEYVPVFAEDKNGIIYAGTNVGLYKSKSPLTMTEENSELPTEFVLYQNYPNPFNPKTVIEYSLPEAGSVSLKVYDLLGKEAVVLVDDEQTAGRYSVEFEAGELSSGIYIYQLRAGTNILSRKMILLK